MGVASTGVRGREEDAHELRRAWTGGRGSDREHGGADAPQLRVAALLLLLCAASVQRRPVTAPGPRRRVRPVSGVGNELGACLGNGLVPHFAGLLFTP